MVDIDLLYVAKIPFWWHALDRSSKGIILELRLQPAHMQDCLKRLDFWRGGHGWSLMFLFASDLYVDGLVIDDVFTICKEEVKGLASDLDSMSFQKLMVAKKIYAREALIGSGDKDVLEACDFKICGVEVLSNEKAVGHGAPTEKRLALAQLTALVASLPSISDALHATPVGSWISIAPMRRQVMAVMPEIFHVVPADDLDTERPILRRLSHAAADELQLLAASALFLLRRVCSPQMHL